MNHFLDFRNALIKYLTQQKELEQADIDKNKHLTIEQKVENGLLIKDAIVTNICSVSYDLDIKEDNTKLKMGDNVLVHHGTESYGAKVIDTGLDSISIETLLPLQVNDNVNIEIIESIYLDPIISLLQTIDEGKPGAYLLKQLAGIEVPISRSLGRIDFNSVDSIPDFLNRRQLEVITDVLLRPSMYCIQGPPGTGKTAVLATIANCFAEKRKDVLIISNTHQAVNNALGKVIQFDTEAQPIKIGELLKSEGMHTNIRARETYNDYLKDRKDKGRKITRGDIVGMTLHSAIINLGLRNSGFQPQIILVDEAGQMPMPYASVIGTFGSGSIIFIGDDKQMPPIFHPDLAKHEFSRSIFSYICEKYPNLRKTLNVTYRMNAEITEWIDNHFYGVKDPKQKLFSSDFSRDRKFPISLENDIRNIEEDALSREHSIYYYNVETDVPCTDWNLNEAKISYMLTDIAVKNGLSVKDIAIITPFRKQVKTIRSVFHDAGWETDSTPIINTVECLQGQDVEFIIISFVVSDVHYLKQHYDFIMDEHRLNVMVSRARTKVVILSNHIIELEKDESRI